PRPARAAPASLGSELALLRAQPLLPAALALFILGLLWPVLGVLDWAWMQPFKSAWWFKGGVPVGLILLAALLLTRNLRRRNDQGGQDGGNGQSLEPAARGPMFGAMISLLNRRHALLLILFIL